MSAILLLDGVMTIISYTSPTITILLSLSMWSQFSMQASTCCIPRNHEHIPYISPVTANFLLKFSNFIFSDAKTELSQYQLKISPVSK